LETSSFLCWLAKSPVWYIGEIKRKIAVCVGQNKGVGVFSLLLTSANHEASYNWNNMYVHCVIVKTTPGLSSRIRYRNQFTVRGWEKTVLQELGNPSPTLTLTRTAISSIRHLLFYTLPFA